MMAGDWAPENMTSYLSEKKINVTSEEAKQDSINRMDDELGSPEPNEDEQRREYFLKVEEWYQWILIFVLPKLLMQVFNQSIMRVGKACYSVYYLKSEEDGDEKKPEVPLMPG